MKEIIIRFILNLDQIRNINIIRYLGIAISIVKILRRSIHGNITSFYDRYLKIFDTILELASKFCLGKLVAVLEGGYNLSFLGKLVGAVTANMAEIRYSFQDKRLGTNLKIRKKGEKMIEEAKKIQSLFWNIKS